MRIYLNELFKIWGKKSFIAIVMVLLVLNAVLLVINENSKEIQNSYSHLAYKDLWEEIVDMPKDTAYETVNLHHEKLSFFFELQFAENEFISEEQVKESYPNIDFDLAVEEFKSENYLKYTSSIWDEKQLYTDVLVEMTLCENYADYLQSIDDSAKRMAGISLFAKKGTFSYNNIVKTPDDFAHLKGNELDYGASKGVSMATNFMATDLIAVIIVFASIMTLITREKELNQMGLAKTSYKGRSHLAAAKLIAIFTTCFIVLILLYGMNLAISNHIYGFGDLSRYIQSVSGFVGSNLAVSVWQYFVLFLISKLFLYFAVAGIVFLISVKAKGSVTVYILVAVFMGIEGTLFYAIPSESYLSMLKYINIFSFTDTYSIISSYKNLNFFSQPINYIPVFAVTVLLLLSVTSILSIIIFSKQKTVSSSGITLPRLGGKLKPLGTHTNIFAHECYKIFIGGKVLPILLIFLAVTLYTYQPMKENFGSVDDIYYKQYTVKLEGEVTQEKLEFIEQEDLKFQQAEEDMIKAMADGGGIFAMMEYQKILAPQAAFNTVKSHAEYLSQTEKGEFVYDTGYKLLTGDESAGTKDLQLSLIAVAMLICCITYVYSIEYQTGTSVLLKSSYKGRKHTFLTKIIISIAIVTAIFAITYTPYLYNVLSTYGTKGMSSPAYSLEHLSGWGISIRGYLILISVFRYVALLLSMFIVFAFSKKLKSFISTILASSAVLILPILLSLLGISIFDYILLNPLLIGNI